MNTVTRSLLLALVLVLSLAAPAFAQTPPVVYAVLFYSPSCAHCQQVISEDLPPLIDTYGEQLQIVAINVTTQGGQGLYQAAVDHFNIPDDRLGVPTLIVGETVLVGSAEIPQQLPGLIEDGLAQGGIDWPEIPGLSEALAAIPTPAPAAQNTQGQATSAAPTAAPPEPTPAEEAAVLPAVPTPESGNGGPLARVLQDPAGNVLAIVVLLGMVVSLVVVGLRLRSMKPFRLAAWHTWAVPVLAVAGAAVALYLTYVETTGDLAVCGPLGDCNAVQQSPYAKLFGVIPVGLVGLLGYAAILLVWLIARLRPGRLADNAAVAQLGMAAFGTIFMVGLTFLEPFVIGATCLWCLSSAVIITGLLWLSTGPAISALDRLEGPDDEGPDEAGVPAEAPSG